MSKTAVATSWRGPYGFAELPDGTAVYIHTDEIGGGRLRIGMDVKLDTEEVEGKGGKLKGTNVSGPAVMEKGAKLSEEDLEADKKRIEVIKEKSKKEFEVVYEDVKKLNRSNKAHMLKTLLKELAVGELKPREVTRCDPTERGRNKRTYTKGEFLAFYGPVQGNKMWAVAGGNSRGRKTVSKE